MRFTVTREPWVDDALCTQVDPDLFFPGKSDQATSRAARRVCAACPVRLECLAYALRTRESDGIWGGLTARQRNDLARRMRNA